MARTAQRSLELLSLLQTANRWNGPELAARLGVSLRTLRRDIDTLRELGYPVRATGGKESTYQLAAGTTLPPLVLDGEQAVAIFLALQTSPTTVLGLRDAANRAMATLGQVMPAPLRAQAEATRVTVIRNHWEFAAPPIAPGTLQAVGDAVRRSHVLRVDVLRADDSRPAPGDPDFSPPVCLEPHNLVLWAGRWYLLAYHLDDSGLPVHDLNYGTNETPNKVPKTSGQPVRKDRSHDLAWEVLRVDRLHVHSPTGVPFTRRELPCDDLTEYVRTRYSRGDIPAAWQCTGVVLINLPADVVARWAPGGSVVEYVSEDQTRLTVGAWSWAGIVGILTTFDAPFTVVEPQELVDACHEISHRLTHPPA